MHPGQRGKARSSGFSLLEVLAAVVVLSIGVLGVAQLQLSGLATSQQAAARGQAALLAAAMADRIRANPKGGYDDLSPSSQPRDCHDNTCTPTKLAKYDVAEWENLVAEKLPDGTSHICRDGEDVNDGTGPKKPRCKGSSADDPYAIKIWWADKGTDQDTAGRKQLVLTLKTK